MRTMLPWPGVFFEKRLINGSHRQELIGDLLSASKAEWRNSKFPSDDEMPEPRDVGVIQTEPFF